MTITYATPDDPAAFASHYLATHVPLVMQVPHLSAFSWTSPATSLAPRISPWRLISTSRTTTPAPFTTPTTVVIGEVVSVPLAAA
ncbi:EthD family reductase [Kribbella deserti]|uniref:EthD family reductase n=1 Tax=Kribbella deserti TaxID=1926257 RepID=A0ABV6QXM7_9ACTN